MGDFDRACRHIARHLDSVGFLTWLLGAEAGLVFSRWMDTRTVADENQSDRTGDLVAEMTEAGVGPYWAVLVEFQSTPDANMFGRLLEVLGRVWQEHAPPGESADRFQIAGVVVNLTGRGRASRDMIAAGGRLRTCLQVIERNLADEDAGMTLETITGGELASGVLSWIPLMRGAGEEGIIKRWQEVAAAHAPIAAQAELATTACILAEAAGRETAWKQALEGWGMQKSQLIEEWTAKAVASAVAKAEASTLAKARAEDILLTLRNRFPEEQVLPLVARIETAGDPQRLREWFKAAMTVSSIEDFTRLLGS